jgi:Flp pilus assembly pilin Flp
VKTLVARGVILVTRERSTAPLQYGHHFSWTIFDAILMKGESSMLEGIRFLLRQCGADEKGVTTVEYAIMLALVAVAVALATPGISDAVTSVFDEAATAMSSS